MILALIRSLIIAGRVRYAVSMNREPRMFAAIEAGGTKFVCAIGDERGALHVQARFPTTTPQETLAQVVDFFTGSTASLSGLGIACFGPIILDKRSPEYGFIGSTPKAGWSHVDIVGMLACSLACPVAFDTDVNAAAMAERRWGAGHGTEHMVYVTVGTGIGGGVLIDGAPLHGLMHPEIGHIRPRRHVLDVDFAGTCPFHGDCLEGLASGPAIVARTGKELQQLDPSHEQWELQADYLGQLCAQLVLTVSPQRIIMGGGVMSQERLFPLVRARMLSWLGGYIDRSEILSEIQRYIVAPGLGARAGVMGALALAMAAAAPIENLG
jgi:fructokinase